MGDLAALRAQLRSYPNLVVAFSGGVDSALLAWVANDELGPGRVVAATAVSPSLAASELDDCRRLAERWSLNWVAVDTDEMRRPEYVANGPDRCYHCKSALMDRLAPVVEGMASRGVVALGVNVDDLSEHRPGQVAAAERGAVFPLVDAGFTKGDVRDAARSLGLEVWDKPSSPCLASRLPHGTPVTLGTLSRVQRAEAGLRALGFSELRVRHYGDLARLELPHADFDAAVGRREEVVAAVKAAGYRYVTLDLESFRSGNLSPSAS